MGKLSLDQAKDEITTNMTDEIKEKFWHGSDAAREAFSDLCAMVDALHAEREEARERAIARNAYLRESRMRKRERNRRMRARYLALLDAYNNLAEEAKDGSDSSSSDSSDGEDGCCIM